MKILSIDPGYERLGIAVLEKEKGGKEKLIYSSVFKTSPKKDFLQRLFEIGQEIERIVKIYSPEYLSIEKIFFNTNQKTAINVSETRGMIIYVCQKNNMKIREFTPLEIKVAVCGYGRADKKQVILMVEKLIIVNKEIKHDDEYDAIACGLTFFAYHRDG